MAIFILKLFSILTSFNSDTFTFKNHQVVRWAESTRVYGYAGTRVHEYTTTQVHGYASTQVHEYTGTRVHGYTGTRLHGYTGTRVHGYMISWAYYSLCEEAEASCLRHAGRSAR